MSHLRKPKTLFFRFFTEKALATRQTPFAISPGRFMVKTLSNLVVTRELIADCL
jgi:hypothetical protein